MCVFFPNCIMSLRYIQVIEYINSWFIFIVGDSYGYTTLCSSIEGHFVCFQVWAIQVKLLWTIVDRLLCGLKFLFLYDKYSATYFPTHKVSLICLTFLKTAKRFFRVDVYHFTHPPATYEIRFSTSWPAFGIIAIFKF